jgi:hypothetical protein
VTSPTPLPRRRTAPAPQVTEREVGHGQAASWWSTYVDDDPTPELRWPQSVIVYDRMMKQDAQVKAVLRAVTLPVQQARWRLDPHNAPDEVAQFVATNLGLPIVGVSDDPPTVPRERDRFAWNQHLAWALKCTGYGHQFFEQVYRLDGDRAYLRKLAPRWPQTIQAINTADDGGLVSIEQRALYRPGRVNVEPVTIGVERLVAYVHEREGGRWQGTSLLRPGLQALAA